MKGVSKRRRRERERDTHDKDYFAFVEIFVEY